MSTAGGPSGIEFNAFVAGIAATAAATLKQIEDLYRASAGRASEEAGLQEERQSPAAGAESARKGLGAARQLIDTLVMLDVKTEGNLTSDEQRLLRDILTELRMTYVRVSDLVSGGRTSP
jgi:hypothetical protein